MELYQLRYFAAIAEAGSLKAAAATCHVTQPTLSTQLKALEDELQTRLLERHPWGIRLTPAGEQVLESAGRIFAEAERLRTAVLPPPDAGRSALRVGVLPAIATEVLSGRLQQVLSETPHTRVVVKERANGLLNELLLKDQVDVCVMLRPTVEPGRLTVEPLARIPYAAYARRDHPLARRRRLGLTELLPYPLIVFAGGLDVVPMLEQAARRQRLGLHLAFRSDQALTAFTMACEGSGVALLPRLFGDRSRRRQIKQIVVDDPRLQIEICAAWRKGEPVTPAMRRLIELTRQHLRPQAVQD